MRRQQQKNETATEKKNHLNLLIYHDSLQLNGTNVFYVHSGNKLTSKQNSIQKTMTTSAFFN